MIRNVGISVSRYLFTSQSGLRMLRMLRFLDGSGRTSRLHRLHRLYGHEEHRTGPNTEQHQKLGIALSILFRYFFDTFSILLNLGCFLNLFDTFGIFGHLWASLGFGGTIPSHHLPPAGGFSCMARLRAKPVPMRLIATAVVNSPEIRFSDSPL